MGVDIIKGSTVYNYKTDSYDENVTVSQQTWDEMNAEISRLREENRKLREAVIEERARALYFNSEREDVAYGVDEKAAWEDWITGIPYSDGHVYQPDRATYRTKAESELRAEGVIE